MKGILHKYQHYVPQCYLKHFGHEMNNGKGYYIYAYSKLRNKMFSQNINNLCGEDFFYSLPDSYISQFSEENLNSLSIELDYFANNVEVIYGAMLSNISQVIKLDTNVDLVELRISNEDKLNIARQIVIQYLRLPEVREQDTDLSNSLDEQMLKLFQEGLSKELNNPGIAELNVKIETNDIVNHAYMSFMNEEIIERFAVDLSNNIWTFYYSDKGEFYTCDSPVFAYGYVKNVRNENMGLTRYGVETSIALNPYLTLSIKDHRYFKNIINENLMISRINEDLLKHYNIIRFCHAKELVFSYNNNFELINDLRTNDNIK